MQNFCNVFIILSLKRNLRDQGYRSVVNCLLSTCKALSLFPASVLSVYTYRSVYVHMCEQVHMHMLHVQMSARV